MDGKRFDGLAVALARSGSRRDVLRLVAGGLLGIAGTGSRLGQAGARRHGGRKRCRGQRREFDWDNENCGRCGRRCKAKHSCVLGHCVPNIGGWGGDCAGWHNSCHSDDDCCFLLACRPDGMGGRYCDSRLYTCSGSHVACNDDSDCCPGLDCRQGSFGKHCDTDFPDPGE